MQQQRDEEFAAEDVTATDLLTAQHREVEELFEAISEANDPEEKQDLFDTLADKLAVHTQLEEQFFYPAVQAKKSEEMVLEAFVEHTTIKQLLVELLDTDPSGTLFDANMKVLEEQVAHHVQEEEEELFPFAKRLLSREELAEVAQEMAALQAELDGTEPRPRISEEVQQPPALG